ncbi:MAG: hypothetical protein OXI25_02770 [Chloroflexota bacterium]|nr:hypothetical protein [Chloroflexota bacterium]
MTDTTDIATTEEAARFLGISARRLRQHQKAGRIFPTPGLNLRSPYGGRCNYYARADLLDLLGGPEVPHALLARRLEDEARRLTESVRYQHTATKTAKHHGVAKARKEAETLRRRAAAHREQAKRLERARLAEIADIERWAERETKRLVSHGVFRAREQVAEQASAALEEIERKYAGELKPSPLRPISAADRLAMWKAASASVEDRRTQPQPQRALPASASTERPASVEATAPQPQPQRERAYGGAGFGEIGAEEERVSVWGPPPGFEEVVQEIRIISRPPPSRLGGL